jgi:hypothetical protein
VRHGVPQGSIFGPLLFLFYINDLPPNLDNAVKPVLFADDISLVISSCNKKQYKNDVNGSFACLNDWFNSNLLTLNFNRTKHVQYEATASFNGILVSYQNNVIVNTTKVKFLGIVMESSCTWKAHIAQILPKLCKVCLAMRVIKPIMSTETQKIVYYSYFHSLMTYGIIFWGIPLQSQYIFSFLISVVNNMGSYQLTSQIHGFNTRRNFDLY